MSPHSPLDSSGISIDIDLEIFLNTIHSFIYSFTIFRYFKLLVLSSFINYGRTWENRAF